jgi:autotransporter-associated beta strand protein
LIVINAALTNNTGLTYSGTAARTALMSPNSVIGGPITINGGESGFPGALVINNQAQLGGATAINFGGGALNINPLATGTGDTLSTPINVGLGGGTINLLPVGVGPLGQGVSATSQVLTLTGALSGTGPLQLNSGTSGAPGGGGTFILAGNASGFSGQVVIAAGVAQFDADARLGTGTTILIGNSNLNQFAELHPTASMSTSKNVYILGTTFVRVDSGATYAMNGFITAIGSAGFRKFGPGELVLTGENTYGGPTLVGSPAVIPGIAGTAAFAATGGTFRVRDGGTLAYTSAYTIAPGSTLIADNTGTANLTNRLNNAPVSLAGGSLVLLGSQTAASTETLGPMTLAANSGSLVEVVPGATQTASLFFSGPTSGLVRNTGSTVTLRAPGLGGTGQINFIHNVPPPPGTGPALTNGILAGVFGENSAGAGTFGLVTIDTVAAVGGFPQYYRTRLLTPAEYTVNAIPDSGVATSNHRQTAPAGPSGSPTINSLFLDTGGSLAIAPGNQVTLTSGTLLMAGGTSISGAGAMAAPAATDLSVYVGAGANATLGTDVQLASSGRVLAKAGPGTLELTAAISATAPPATIAVQRGTFRLGTGGSIPAASIVSVDGGATFDVNGAGSVVEVARLSGLGAVQLGSTSGTVLRVNTPSAANMIFGGTITGTGSFEKAGAGTFSFGATASFAGPITFSAGFLNIGEGVSFSPIIPVVAGGAITMADGTDLSVINVQDFQRSIVVNVGTSTGTAILDTFSGFGTTRFSGPITIDANKTLRLNAGSTGLIRVSGQISGGGALAFGAGASGPIIEGNNTYTGGTSVLAAATIGVGSDTAFGTGAITNTAALNLFAFGGNRTVANAVNFNADITYGSINPVYQGFDLTFTGPATINANRTVTTTAAGRLTLTNVSDGGGVFSLTKAGGGTLALAGANNTYSGATNVNAGTLIVNGTLTSGGGTVTAASAAVLGGAGTINRAVTINSGGTVKPGNSTGTLTVGGSVTLSANSTYLWELGANTTSGAGTNWSQIVQNGGILTVDPAATFVPAFVGTATLPSAIAFWQAPQRWDNVIDVVGGSVTGTTFVINNSAWSSFGMFSTIPAVIGTGVALQWTPVPEPIHVFLACIGAAGVFHPIRRRIPTLMKSVEH